MDRHEPVAIIGIGCRFPGASGPQAFWRLLADGIDAISEVPGDRWSLDDLHDDDPAAPGKMNTRWGGFVADVDRFDAAFFGISPREAVHIDPQQRLLMEVAWEALEDAGLAAEKLRGQPVGVFVGVSSYDYGSRQLTQVEEIRDGYVNTGSALSMGANRLSYLFDFRGPSLVIDTACSSSLVAAYYACQSLRNAESTIALAGGVNLLLSPAVTVGFSKLQAMAPDGRCKAFDARANGYVRGEGAGMVVLKPLARALADGDRIYAVIRGGAVNQDGKTNGLTAPNGLSQEALVREALANAGVRPAEIRYVEAHGTGTALGDPIELNALGAVLAAGRPRDARCAVGSVKTNFGHLEAAAGVAGLIKVALALDRRQLPPSLHFEKPNPYIRFDVLPLRVVTRLEAWPNDSGRARAGVSAFGFGGTNAHLVLEEAPPRAERAGAIDDACVLPLSAKSEQALASLARAYAARLTDEHAAGALVDICATAAVRRSHHDFRLAAVAASRAEMASKLAAFVDGESPRELETGRRIASRRRKVTFVFPGQGSQWLGMGRELTRREPVFREALETCAAAIARNADWSLITELEAAEDASRLQEVDVIQPAIFAVQVALAALWRSWGIAPDAVIGHSMGEVAAAHVAGALSIDDATRIICGRSRLAKRTSGRGAMAVVELSLEQSTEMLAGYEDRVAVAVNNSPTSTVLSGDADVLEEVLARVEGRGVFCRRIKVDYASHSPQMDVLREDLIAMLHGIAPRRTKVPLYSTVTGTSVAGADLGAEYWFSNLRQPVLFAGVIEKQLEDGIDVFLEISPHPILLPAIQQCLLHAGRNGTALPSLRRNESERRSLLSTTASLYAIGRALEWSRIYPAGTECVVLPTYAWQRERFWIDESSRAGQRRATVNGTNPLIGEHVQPATGTGTHLWQREIGPELFPFLKDHRVQGEIVVPATAYLEIALEAARKAFGCETSITLENVRFDKALVLTAREVRQIQIVLTRQVPTRFEWQVFGESPGAAGQESKMFSRHACGEIRIGSVDEPRPADESLSAAQARCATEQPGADHYRRMADLHLDYGPSFQGVETIWAGDGEALGRLKPPVAEARHYRIHPAVLDSAFQVLVAALPADARSTMVPVSIDCFHLHQPEYRSGGLWAHASLRTDASGIRGDVRLLTLDGELVAEALGIGLARLHTSAPSCDAFYALGWDEQSVTQAATERQPHRAVLIIADRSGVGAALAGEISAGGGQAIVVKSGAALHIPDPIGGGDGWTIDTARGDDYCAVLGEVARRGISLDSVVHLSSLDVGEETGDAAALSESVLLLVQALVRTYTATPPRLWLTTRAAQYVLDGEDVSPFRAPLWGLARTIAQEHPELLCTAVDLGSEPIDAEGEALHHELWRNEREQQVAFRGDHRYVARLKAIDSASVLPQTAPVSQQRDEPPPFRLHLVERGNLQSMAFRQTARRRPTRGDVEIEVVAAGLNFRDVLFALGLLPSDGEVVLGHECAGRITAVGDGVTEWAVGDQVVALARSSFSSHVLTRASLVARKPERLDFEEAATIPIAFLTAHYALNHLARLQRAERVLIHSATGAVGLACVRLAQEAAAEIYATAGTDDKRRFLKDLGVRRAMDSRSLSFAAEILESTGGEGVDVIVNSLTGEAFARSLRILAPGGRFVELGKRDSLEGAQIPLRTLDECRSLFLVDLSSLADKRPDTCGRLLRETLRLVEESQFPPIPRQVFPATQVAEAFQHMAGARHTGKVVIRMDRGGLPVAPATDPAARICDDATYVLTGGLGGIALAVARWLVDKGATHLVLVGRSEPSADARAAIEKMRRAGAIVIVEHVDVTDAPAVDAAFARWARDLPRVRGIVHAAGVLEDAILLQQTPEQFRRVMAPKVAGAWNLHRASVELGLDFFLLFSSAASVFGSAGQSNYAAANQFLDALAHHRRACKLPATSINWGPWAEVGLAARPDRGGRLESRGIASLTVERGLEALGQLLVGDVAQLTVMSVDWAAWRDSHPLLAQMPCFAPLAAAAHPDNAQEPARRELLSVSPEDRRGHVEERLRQHAAAVLRLPAGKIDIDQPLVTMGIDSLMAVELKSRVQRELGIEIPLLQLIKGPSLSELARTLAGAIAGDTVSPSESERKRVVPEVSGQSLLLSMLSLKDSAASFSVSRDADPDRTVKG